MTTAYEEQGVGAGATGGGMRIIDDAELAAHGGAHASPWTAYNGVVYDLSGFAREHPGGAVVLLAAGRNGTQLIDSYHDFAAQKGMRAAQARLPVVGRQAAAPAPAPAPAFYADVQQRVDARLRELGLDPHAGSIRNVLEFVLMVILYVVGCYFRIVYGALWGAVLAGLVTVRLGFLMHLANHGAAARAPSANALMSTAMGVIGMSSYVWRFEHQVAHHLYPNVFGVDNDCAIGDPVLRFSEGVPEKAGHRFQHITTFVLMTLGLFKWFFVDFVYMFAGRAGSVSFQPSAGDKAYLLFSKTIWIGLQIALPMYLHGVWPALLGVAVMFGFGAHYMGNIFIVNHIQPDLVPPRGTHWSLCQVYGSSNWCSGSRIANVVSGGLNHQIEHHLFPSYSIYVLPHISGVVREACRDHGVPYHNFDSFSDAWWSTVEHLRVMGGGTPTSSRKKAIGD